MYAGRMEMWRHFRARWAQAAAAALAAAVLLGASAGGQGRSGLVAGQLLIAAPTIGDPRFSHAVILMLRQDDTGAFGIVLNQPIEERTVASLLDAAGDHEKGLDGSLQVFAGGPVQPELGFVVHSPDYRNPDTMTIGGEVAMTADKQILRDIGHHKGPAKALFAYGYAGWGPGQLEGEIAQNAWFTTTGDPKLIFDDDRGRLWDDAMARRTREL
jgi:putative transcriptional regulator